MAQISNSESPLIPEGLRLVTLGPVEEPVTGRAATCRTRRRTVCDPQLALALVLTFWDLIAKDYEDCSQELRTTLGALEINRVIVDCEDLGDLPKRGQPPQALHLGPLG